MKSIQTDALIVGPPGKHKNKITNSGGVSGKEIPLPVQKTQKMQVRSLGQEDPLEEGMATHSSVLSWRIPWTEGPGGLQSMRLQEELNTTEATEHAHTHG